MPEQASRATTAGYLDQILTNLDIYLMPAASENLNSAIEWSSSSVDSVEHIFWNIQTPGEYKLVVVNNGGLGEPEEYGLAWRFGNSVTPGDFDEDGDVDGRDFMEWQRGNSPDPLGSSDLGDWQSNYGNPLVATSQSVPEPHSCLLLAIGLSFVALRKFRTA